MNWPYLIALVVVLLVMSVIGHFSAVSEARMRRESRALLRRRMRRNGKSRHHEACGFGGDTYCHPDCTYPRCRLCGAS